MLEDLSKTILRQIIKLYNSHVGIKNFYKKSKEELIQVIKEKMIFENGQFVLKNEPYKFDTPLPKPRAKKTNKKIKLFSYDETEIEKIKNEITKDAEEVKNIIENVRTMKPKEKTEKQKRFDELDELIKNIDNEIETLDNEVENIQEIYTAKIRKETANMEKRKEEIRNNKKNKNKKEQYRILEREYDDLTNNIQDEKFTLQKPLKKKIWELKLKRDDLRNERNKDTIQAYFGLGKPTNQKLYDEIKKEVYSENPKHSLFRSAQLVKQYKNKGGEYVEDTKKPDMNIYKWFKQNWISLQDYYYNNDIIPCGSSDTMSKYGDYPLCRPLKIAESLTKEQIKKMIDEKNKLKEKHLKTKKVLGTDKFNIKSTTTGMK